MESYETFKRRNAAFGSYGIVTENEMQANYAIALNVEKAYSENFGNMTEPKIGDIVEFSNGYKVFKYAQISENLYGGSEYGMLCVCECGSSHTNGENFSTSGGAFWRFHKSNFQLVGETENVFWTWGCHGSGGNQGIYFPLKVHKWIIPYEPIMNASKVIINGSNKKNWRGETMPAVTITNSDQIMGYSQSFCSVKAFNAWAEYVGFKHESFGRGTFERRSAQRIEDKCYTDPAWKVPKGAKPIKIIRNGSLKDAWVVTTPERIMYYWPNIYDPQHKEPQYGTPEYEKKLIEYRKYDGNPLGV